MKASTFGPPSISREHEKKCQNRISVKLSWPKLSTCWCLTSFHNSCCFERTRHLWKAMTYHTDTFWIFLPQGLNPSRVLSAKKLGALNSCACSNRCFEIGIIIASDFRILPCVLIGRTSLTNKWGHVGAPCLFSWEFENTSKRFFSGTRYWLHVFTSFS